jgi:hypothetical protein
VLRFVSNAVMVGFINAVGINIVLGQFDNLTRYSAEGADRLARAANTVLNPGELDGRTLLVGAATIGLIVLIERTRLGALGLVVAVIVTSAAASAVDWTSVATPSDLGISPDSLPTPPLPSNHPEADGTYPDASQDFVGQGAESVASGFLRGMPTGGSVSTTAIPSTLAQRSLIGLVTGSRRRRTRPLTQLPSSSEAECNQIERLQCPSCLFDRPRHRRPWALTRLDCGELGIGDAQLHRQVGPVTTQVPANGQRDGSGLGMQRTLGAQPPSKPFAEHGEVRGPGGSGHGAHAAAADRQVAVLAGGPGGSSPSQGMARSAP